MKHRRQADGRVRISRLGVRNGWVPGRAGGRCDLPTNQRNLHMGLKKMKPDQLIAMSSTDGWELKFQNFQEIAQTRIKENEI